MLAVTQPTLRGQRMQMKYRGKPFPLPNARKWGFLRLGQAGPGASIHLKTTAFGWFLPAEVHPAGC